MIDSYNKLPLGIYLRIRELQDQEMDDTDRTINVVSLLTGKSEREILNAKISDFHAWAAAAAFLYGPAPQPGRRIADSYQAGGFDLVPTTDLRKITTAQYIDFQAFAQGGEQQMPQLLSVFLVPRGHKYNDDYDVLKVQQALREDLTVSETVTLCAFFLTKYAGLIRTTRRYLARIQKEEKDPRRKVRIRTRLETMETLVETLQAVGAGSATSTP